MKFNAPLLLLIISILAFYSITPVLAVDLKVHFIDVGQGDSILLQSGGKNMLVDAGPGESGSQVVSYLRSQGVSTLDVVAATHPHEDHIGGMLDVLKNFNIGLYVDNGVTHTTSTYEKLINKLLDDQTPYAEVKAGKTIPFAPGITVSVISPVSISGDMNEDSLVLKITDDNEKILLTGDSSQIPGDVHAQILKVPHHGSQHSSNSAYYNKVKPEVAVICVGQGNDYGHPSSKVVNNIEQIGAEIYRTDRDGTVVISTDGNTWSVNHPGSTSSSSFSQPVYLNSKVSSPKTATRSYTPIVAPAVVQSSPQTMKNSQTSTSEPCNCGGPDLNCNGFSSHQAAQSCFEYCKNKGYGDCFRLDRDKDGKVCESL